ncbi:MAG: DUF2961 domain-containing protein [Acidobacteriota bacterium]
MKAYRFLGVFVGVWLAAVFAPAQEFLDVLGLSRLDQPGRSRRVSSFDRTGGNNDRFENIADGERRVLFEVAGAGIIRHIWITIAPPPPALSRNDIILRMYWDGNPNPCVESPIGPFFGQGWDESYNFSSFLLAAGPRTGRGLVSYFPMPFANGAKIEVENQTGRKIDAFYYYIDYVELPELPEGYGRFHAWYNHELTEADPAGENEWGIFGPQPKNPSGEGNYLVLDARGKGRFVGVNYYVHSPGPMWYGEGDDMIFIDGDERPTLHGTGTEDYFNTSWSPEEEFSHPFYGLARVGNQLGWLGRAHLYRFHILDPIEFEKSLRFTIEHGHANNLTLDLATVAYWYQSEPHQPFPPLVSKEQRRPKPDIGVVEIHRWRDAWRKSKGGDRELWGNEP